MGRIHIYCGDGKGKTTTAIGLTIRNVGAGGSVLFTQFMKDGTSSECSVLQQMPAVDVLPGYPVECFSFQMTPEQRAAATAGSQKQFADLKAAVQRESYTLVVLDEIFSCIRCGFLPQETVLHWLETRPAQPDIVLTGRDPAPELLALADYVSEIVKRKHPFDQGVIARKGIEY